MKALKTTASAIALVTALGTASTGHANTYPTGRFGAWETFAGIGETDTGMNARLCGAEVTGTDRMFLVKVQQGFGMFLQINKTGWSIPTGQTVSVVMQVDRAAPFNLTGKGINLAGGLSGVEIDISTNDVWPATDKPMIEEVINLLSSGNQVHFYFPNGTEQPWVGALSGAGAALQSLDRCIETTMAPPATPTQPYGNTPSQPYTPAARTSQPF